MKKRNSLLSEKPAPVAARKREGKGELVRRFEVISPMIGGGVFVDPENTHLKKPDPVTPIRPASIRGQLRFWWRATQAHTFAGVADMRARETSLWGAASTPGAVSLRVEYSGRSTPQPAPPLSSDLGYGAFTLRPTQKAPDKSVGNLAELRGPATLTLSIPEAQRAEVELAVDAWLNFGGLGGRTRRGFGAVAAVAGEKVQGGLAILNALAAKTVSRELRGMPHLCGAAAEYATWGQFASGAAALDAALGRLRRFRQGRDFARNPGTERPGRSRWPEPNEIRRITRRAHPDHRPPDVGVHKMPRAVFGMPIIFHFKDRDDPGDASLQPAGHERLASPLILRPIRDPDGKRFTALALVLQGTLDQTPAGGRCPQSGLVLKGAGGHGDDPHVAAELTVAEAQEIRPLAGNPDPLRRFLEFFTTNA